MKPNKNPIRIGLLGLGRAGMGMHCKELEGKEDQFRIVAACDPIPSRLEQMREKYDCRTYETLESFLADPDIEMVDITTRSSDHYEHAMLALSAGKSVFLEKPMTLGYEDALRLKKTAERSRGQLYIRHNRRFDPDFLHIREIIDSGKIGEVFEIKLSRHGFSRRDDWQTLQAYGGGQLLNWGPHIIDHALVLLDSPLQNVWSDLKRVAAAGDAEDHIKIVMKGANGKVVDIEISGGVAIPSPVCQVYGKRGSLSLIGGEIRLRYVDPSQSLTEPTADPGTPGETPSDAEELSWIDETFPVGPTQTYDIWNELYKAEREGAEFQIRIEEAVEVMRVISLVKAGTEFESV